MKLIVNWDGKADLRFLFRHKESKFIEFRKDVVDLGELGLVSCSKPREICLKLEKLVNLISRLQSVI
jgi:hypothetical protein